MPTSGEAEWREVTALISLKRALLRNACKKRALAALTAAVTALALSPTTAASALPTARRGGTIRQPRREVSHEDEGGDRAGLAPAVHRELGAFISLIVVNCLILGRQEAFASKNPVHLALADAAGMGAGFTFALVLLGGAREVLGKGALFGFSLFGDSFEPWVIMILPPGGFLMLGVLLLIFAWLAEKRERWIEETTIEEEAA